MSYDDLLASDAKVSNISSMANRRPVRLRRKDALSVQHFVLTGLIFY